MSTSCLLRFSRERLAILRAAILWHAERLQALLRPSWPNAGEIQDEMYRLVDTLMSAGVDQKWFSAYMLVEGAELMLTTPEIHVVGLGFCLSACNDILTNRFFCRHLITGCRKHYH